MTPGYFLMKQNSLFQAPRYCSMCSDHDNKSQKHCPKHKNYSCIQDYSLFATDFLNERPSTTTKKELGSALVAFEQVKAYMYMSWLSKVARCQRKSPPAWLVLAGYSAWHFFTDGIFKMKYPWTGRLLLQLSHLLQNFVTTLKAGFFISQAGFFTQLHL